MSLTAEDIYQIRQVVREEVEHVVEEKVSPLRGDIKALSNDVKEIYAMLSDLEKQMREIKKASARLEQANPADKAFIKLDLEQKMLKMNTLLLATAKQVGLTLPR